MKGKSEPNHKLTIITGELSGEIHASHLIDRLSEISDLRFSSMGGDLLKRKTELIFDYREISVTGFTEVFPKAHRIIKAYITIRRHLERERPLAVILVDFPGFNLRIAKLSKSLGIPVIYLIPPQVWAWGKSRLKTIKRCVDLVISFLPFEREFYSLYGIRCEFVGHPYTYLRECSVDRDDFIRRHSIPYPRTILGILPGSRRHEVKRHMPVISDVIEKLRERLEEPFFLISAVKNVGSREIEKFLKDSKDLRVIENSSIEILSVSACAIVSSGSATLEASLLGVPTVVIYRLSNLSYLLAKILVKVPYVSLPNLILNEKVFPEFVQRIDPATIAETVCRMLKDDERERLKERSEKLYRLLKRGDPYMEAAKIIMDLLEEKYGSLS